MSNTEALVQRTQEWLKARTGHVTASKFKDVMARLKSGAPAQARKDYLVQVVAERLTGQPTNHYVTPAMQWGTEQEGPAREAYIAKTGHDVLEVGFIKHPTMQVGASPDGIIMLDGDTGCLEIKCPNTATFIEWALAGELPDAHKAQVQGQMWLTQSSWAHFVAFDPRLEPSLRMFMLRVERDEAYIEQLNTEVCAFLAEIDETIEKLLRRI